MEHEWYIDCLDKCKCGFYPTLRRQIINFNKKSESKKFLYYFKCEICDTIYIDYHKASENIGLAICEWNKLIRLYRVIVGVKNDGI